MEDTINSPQGGFLKIFKGDKLLHHLHDEGENIILNNYRLAMARLAMMDSGIENFEDGDTILGEGVGSRVYDSLDSNSKTVEGVIPYSLVLDNKGALLDGDPPTSLDIEGIWTILAPDSNTMVDPTDYEQEVKYNFKEIKYAPNIVTTSFNIQDESINPDLIFTRATLVSRDGQPLATKCFKGVRKGDAGLIFEWSIAY